MQVMIVVMVVVNHVVDHVVADDDLIDIIAVVIMNIMLATTSSVLEMRKGSSPEWAETTLGSFLRPALARGEA